MDGSMPCQAERWSRRDTAALALVLLVASVLFFSRLRAPLLEPQEARYAETPREMLAAGEWVVPLLDEQPYLDKPPLLNWGVMASYRLFGVRDRSARLVPAVAGVLTAAVVFLWGRFAFGRRAGLLAALVLCLTPMFVYRGRMLGFDTVLMPCVAAALAAGHVAVNGERLRRAWWLVSALASGVGLLAKGPVTLVLVAVPVALVCWRDRRCARPGALAIMTYLAVAALVAAPWYVAIVVRHPEFADYFLWRHNVVRFAAPFDHAGPLWYYLPGLALGVMPWALLVPALARAVWRGEAPAAIGLPLVAFAWGLLFFSLAGSKRPSYLLPILPPLALALGWALHVVAADLGEPRRLAFATMVVTLGGSVVLVAAAWRLDFLPSRTAWLLAGLGGVGLLATLSCHRRIGWGVSLGGALACAYLGVQFLLPAYHDQFSLRGALRRQARGRALPPVVCYPQRFDSLGFYLPDHPVRAFTEEERGELMAYLRDHPDALLVAKSGRTWRQLVASLPNSVEVRGSSARVALTVGRLGPRARTSAPSSVSR